MSSARDSKELANLFVVFQKQFDRLHVVTLLHRCGSLSVSAAQNPWVARSYALLEEQISLKDPRPARVSAREVCSTLWALAKVSLQDESPLLELLTQRLLSELATCKPQELANATWAYARLEKQDPALLDALAGANSRASGRMTSQHLANVSWAFGKLSSPQHLWFRSAAEAVVSRGAEAVPARHLVNILWGFARVGLRHGGLFAHLGDAVADATLDLGAWAAQDLSGVVWSFASLEVVHAGLFERVSQQAQRRLAEFGPQEMQNLAWAYAVATRGGGLDARVHGAARPCEGLLTAVARMPRNRRSVSREPTRVAGGQRG